MLRNRGVNATERRIRQDVLKAYEYDAFEVMNEPRYQSNFHRQPKYCTARTTRPIYFHTSSSVSSYGVKRVYLPDEDYGTGTDESSLYIRNPGYSTGCYPGDINHSITRYLPPYYYYPRCSRYKKLVRKVTRKLSPIFPCDCATTSNVRDMKKNNKNDLSKEAKELSRDVFKIISLLQRADGEDEEQFSSVSLLQNIQNLDCHSSNSYSNLITQRVNVYPKVDKQKQGDPLTKFRSASGVRGKLEALVDALKQYETEKCNRDSSNSNNVIPSDPHSVETRSFFSGKILKSSTTLFGGKHKDIVLQTEQPKTSNKSVCGKVKTKKGDSSAVGKSLKSRLSWRRKEGSGIKMRRDSANERLSDKKTERKRSLFSKTKSRSKIRSIIESEESQSEKNDAPKKGQTNKAGLMIQIGGNSTRKKSASIKEKYKEKKPKLPKPPKPPKPWIKKFVEESHDTKNNIRIRWNNKAFYTKSSSTIVELVHNVYKHMGIHKNSKSDETTSINKKTPKTITPKDSKAKMQKSPKKTKRNKQKLEAYMMPEIIVPGPFYRPNVINKYVEKNASKSYLNEFTPKFYYGLNTTNVLSTNYFEILLPENLIFSMSEEPTSDTGYKIIEYEATSKETLMDNVNGMTVDQEDFKETGSFETTEHMHAKLVQMSDNSLCSRKRSEDSEMNVIRKGPKPKKSRIQVQELNAEETESRLFERRFCFLADRIIQAKCLNWKPMSSDSFVWADCEELDDTTTKSVLEQIQISSIHDDISNKTSNIATESVNDDFTQNNVTYNVSPRESKEVYIRRKFGAFNNNLVQWNKRVTGTFSESIIGILSRKSLVMPALWSLVKILRKHHSPESRRGPPPQDLSLVQPPGTVSQPDCSHKSLNLYLPRRPLQFLKQKLTLEPLILAQLSSVTLQAKKELALVDSSQSSIQCDELANDAVDIEKSDSTEESDAFMLYKPRGPINYINTVKAMVLDAKNIQQDISSTPPSILSCTIRLVRSVTNLQTEKKIKPKATRSVILLQKQKYQTKSLLLLFVQPILHGNARIGQTLVEDERHYQNLTECYSESTEYELQDIQLESVDSNKVTEETVENNHDIIRSENRSYVIAEKLPPDNTDSVEVLCKQEKNVKECNFCRKCEGQNICYNDKKKNKHLAHVTQMSKIENNKSSLHIPCILDKKPAAQFSVEIKKGDKITKILIKNNKSNKKNNKTSTNVIISQAPLITNNAEPIKQSTKRNSRKNIKVCINISNITDKEPENSENHLNKQESNNVFTNQLCTEKAEEQVAVTEYTDLNDTIDGAVDSPRCAVYKSCSLQSCTECLQNDDTNGTDIQHDITKSTGEKKIFTEFNDFKTDFSPTDSYLSDIAAEEYVNEILGSADIIDHTKLKKVVEMKALKNTMLLNLSAFAVMAFKRELASDHTDTYKSLRQQLKRRKNIVSILSEINMRNTTDCLGEQAKTGKAEYFNDLQSSVTCSLCNIFERKPISHHVKANIETNFYVRPKKDFAANDLHLVSSLTQQRLELEEFLSLLKDERTSNSDKFIDIDDTGLGALLKRSMLYSKRNPTEKIHANPSPCVRNMNSMSKKKQKQLQTKKHTNRYLRSCQNNDIILTRTGSSKTLISPYTEYKVRIKNVPMKTGDTVEKTYSEVNKSDILQSCKVKKAVLQLYSKEETVNEGYLVARVPKYLRL